VIQQVAAYQVGQLVFPTLQEAQKSELKDLMPDEFVHADGNSPGLKVAPDDKNSIADFIVAHTDDVVAILTCQPRTKKPRSDKGKKRGPKAATSATP
jgi:hypothetical protein